MIEEQYSMVQECTNKYSVKERENGGVEIYIEVPKRFKDLWVIKLSELKTNEKEIKEYE